MLIISLSQYINNLETKKTYKRTVNLTNIITFFKISDKRFKNYSLICLSRPKKESIKFDGLLTKMFTKARTRVPR